MNQEIHPKLIVSMICTIPILALYLHTFHKLAQIRLLQSGVSSSLFNLPPSYIRILSSKYPHPRAISSKRGGGGRESLVTSTRKAVDFQRVIIHVIIVGHSYFYNILCTCKLGAAKYGERVGPVNKLQLTSILDCLDLHPFRTSKSCNFRGLVWAYKFISS